MWVKLLWIGAFRQFRLATIFLLNLGAEKNNPVFDFDEDGAITQAGDTVVFRDRRYAYAGKMFEDGGAPAGPSRQERAAGDGIWPSGSSSVKALTLTNWAVAVICLMCKLPIRRRRLLIYQEM